MWRTQDGSCAFIEGHYGIPYEVLARQNCLCAGSPEQCITWLKAFIAVGAQTIVVRLESNITQSGWRGVHVAPPCL